MRVLLCALFLSTVSLQAQTLIIGILGGWQKYDAPHRAVRKLALHLRDQNHAGVVIETFENHRRGAALARVKEWRAGSENNRRVIIYGQSFGGAAAVYLDRDLAALGIPVALSVHIDSVGTNDRVIPANVAAAANFFEREAWLIHGQPKIVAQDPLRTKILGNFEFHYRGKQIDESQERWTDRAFFGTHLKMEDDPAVWAAVEKLIVEHLERD